MKVEQEEILQNIFITGVVNIFPTAILNPVNGISCAGATVVPLNTPERPTDGPNIHPLWLLTPITIVVLTIIFVGLLVFYLR